MSGHRTARGLVWSALGIGAVSFVFYLASGITRGLSWRELDPGFAIAFGMFLPLGAFIVLSRPGNRVGWIMTAIGWSTIVGTASTEYATRALEHAPESLPAGREVAFLSSFLGIPGIGLMAFLMLLFPNGELLSPRWKWVGRIGGANLAFITVVELASWSHRGLRFLDDDGFATSLLPEWVFQASWFVVMLSSVLGLASLVFRFRRSSGVERQQLKWMAFIATVVGSLILMQFFIFEPLGIDEDLLFIGEQVLNLSVAGIPIAAAIAISRYRLYEIDVVINRTLVYGSLTAILVGTYVGLVFALQALLAPVTAESDLAVAASTLAVAALFRPLRDRIQGFIDRRFYRRKFDAQKTVEDFGAHLRDEVDIDSLSRRFVGAVQDTMQPAHVSLWLRKEVAP